MRGTVWSVVVSLAVQAARIGEGVRGENEDTRPQVSVQPPTDLRNGVRKGIDQLLAPPSRCGGNVEPVRLPEAKLRVRVP